MRRVLITGANKGLGLALAKNLLEKPEFYVLLGSRDVTRGEEALKSLLDIPANEGRAELVQIDVSDGTSITKAAEQVTAKYGANSIYGVVNNAGLGSRSPGDEMMKVNYMGARLVVDAFLPLLVENARIVNVSSIAGQYYFASLSADVKENIFLNPAVTCEQLDTMFNQVLAVKEKSEYTTLGLGDWTKEDNFYSLSKAMLLPLSVAQANKYPNLKVNSFEPGVVETDMTRPMFERMGDKSPFEKMGFPTTQPDAGVKGMEHLLVADLEGNGRFYGSDCKRQKFDVVRKPFVDPPYEGP
mmetsp:Transcript_70105/g.146191  ORF Transcript_70105/g.146191 Transcript_70105/m.146191 type:complete len:299 (+) Transcript_70105:41-937(+)